MMTYNNHSTTLSALLGETAEHAINVKAKSSTLATQLKALAVLALRRPSECARSISHNQTKHEGRSKANAANALHPKFAGQTL